MYSYGMRCTVMGCVVQLVRNPQHASVRGPITIHDDGRYDINGCASALSQRNGGQAEGHGGAIGGLGSRKQELSQHFPLFIQVAEKLRHKNSQIQFILGLSHELNLDNFNTINNLVNFVSSKLNSEVKNENE